MYVLVIEFNLVIVFELAIACQWFNDVIRN